MIPYCLLYTESMHGVSLVLAIAQITRLHSSDFPQLPPNIAKELQRRNCAIPQPPMVKGRQNVVKGEFAKPGQTDWAVLCSANGAASILVFWNGSESNPAQIEARQEEVDMQSWTNNKMVFSRMIAPIDKPKIMEYYNAFGGEKPPPMDHQGIEDSFVGKASVVLYFYRGKWLHLTGAD
jgi:hypothetical protein